MHTPVHQFRVCLRRTVTIVMKNIVAKYHQIIPITSISTNNTPLRFGKQLIHEEVEEAAGLRGVVVPPDQIERRSLRYRELRRPNWVGFRRVLENEVALHQFQQDTSVHCALGVAVG